MYKVMLKEEKTGNSEDHEGYYEDVVIFDNISKEDLLAWIRTKEVDWLCDEGHYWEESLPKCENHTMLWLDWYPEPFDEQQLESLHNAHYDEIHIAKFDIAHDIYEGEEVIEESADIWDYNLVVMLSNLPV